MLLNRWNDTDLHYFGGCGKQNHAFLARRDFGTVASARAGASRPPHQNRAGLKKHDFACRIHQNNVNQCHSIN